MTGRPPLAPGAQGAVTVKKLDDGRHRARVVVRDPDGKRREVTATAASKGAALRKMQTKLATRSTPTDTGVNASMTVAELADYFLEHRWRQTFTDAPAPTTGARRTRKKKLAIKPQTVAAYDAAIRATVKPTLGALRLHEVTVGRLDTVLADLEHHGISTYQMRSVLSQMFGIAVRHGALAANPMALVASLPREDHEVEALELEQVWDLRHLVRPEVQGTPGRRKPNRDLCEYVDVALGTGARISEVLALQWMHLDLDSETPTALIDGTLVEPRKGFVDKLHRQEHTKGGDTRCVILPDHVVALLRARRARVKHVKAEDPVFASGNGTWLWPNNIRTRLRAAIGGSELEGTTPHTLRRTVGTVITHEVGLDTAREQLGHAHPGVTGRYYVARRKLGPDVRDVLSPFFGGDEASADDSAA